MLSRKMFQKLLTPSALPVVPRPFVALFNITEWCNFRCRYCVGSYFHDRHILTLPQIQGMLDGLYRLGVRMLGLAGGEPLLHPDIDQVITYAHHLGFNVALNTNGTLVPKHLEALKQLDVLTVSLDAATADINDHYRGPYAFDHAIRALDTARAAGIPLQINTVLTDRNVTHLKPLLELAERYEAPVSISPMFLNVAGNAHDHVDPVEGPRLRRALADIQRLISQGYPIRFSPRTFERIGRWPDPSRDWLPRRLPGYPRCVAGKKYIYINNRGEMFPCALHSQPSTGRNVIELGVEQAFRTLQKPRCASCRWACMIEFHATLNWEPSALRNTLRTATLFQPWWPPTRLRRRRRHDRGRQRP